METNWIRNPDGSIYHLKLKPGDLSPIIISVGDPDRVHLISRYFDSIEFKVQSREFCTVTGMLAGKRISILSTGIGTDNIDIVMNEVDALFNIDLNSSETIQELTSVKWIRLGTSGAIQNELAVDSILITDWSIGTDSLTDYYQHALKPVAMLENGIRYFIHRADQPLLKAMTHPEMLVGNTFTAVGFYGPQGRFNRVKSSNLLNQIESLDLVGIGKLSNLEMETSAIYGLSHLFGFQSVSINAILANRITGKFSKSPEQTITRMIELSLERLLGY